MGEVTIRFDPSGRRATVPAGSTLLAAARAIGLEIDAPCSGAGTCGSCRVLAEGALSPLGPDERELLGGAGVAAGKRLACRARALGDVVVTVPEGGDSIRIVTHAQGVELAVEPPSARGIDVLGPVCGAAVDIGTTTIVVELVDLRTGESLSGAGALNAQRTAGADVMSRIAYASAGGADELRRAVIGQIGTLAADALATAGREPGSLAEFVLVGNTAMLGLALGTDVAPLGSAPYAGAHLDAHHTSALALGLDAYPSADVHALPCIGPFVGADITAGLLATGLPGAAGSTLLLDLGTNGELVLVADGRLTATSTAAGPAFEGAEISCGMRAEAGAIERVDLDGETLALGVIGEREPVGLCGSGLIDLVAILLEAGALESDGRFADEPVHPLGTRLRERDGVREFVVDAAAGIVLTQKDVRQVQLAIGAVRAGTALLLADAGLAPGAVAEVIVAGGFGYHLRSASLARIGLVDATWADRVRFAGNTALAGARMALVSSDARRAAESLAHEVRTVDLAADPRFQERFLGSLEFAR